jgi:hypothetical protein
MLCKRRIEAVNFFIILNASSCFFSQRNSTFFFVRSVSTDDWSARGGDEVVCRQIIDEAEERFDVRRGTWVGHDEIFPSFSDEGSMAFEEITCPQNSI